MPRVYRDAVDHGTVQPARARVHRWLLLAEPRRTRAVFAVARAPGACRTPLRSRPGEARRDALSWRLRGRSDRGRLSRRRLVFRRDAEAARAHRQRAPESRQSARRRRVLPPLALSLRAHQARDRAIVVGVRLQRRDYVRFTRSLRLLQWRWR